MLFTVVAALGILWYHETTVYLPSVQKVGETVSLRVQVTAVAEAKELTVLEGDLPTGTRVMLWNEPMNAALNLHDVIETTFELRTVESEGLALRQCKAEGVWLAVVPLDLSKEAWKIMSGEASEDNWFTDTRERLSLLVRRHLSGDIGAVITGICFGEDEALSSAAKQDFRACNVSHLFAVSGLHLSILIQAILWFLKRLRMSRRLRGGVCVMLVLFFSALVGWTPSVFRAAVLCVIVVAGECARRQADVRNSLGLALFVLLVAQPFAAYDAGLLLSFLATFGLLFVAPVLRRALSEIKVPKWFLPLWKPFCVSLAVSLSATFSTLPVMVLYFGQLSLVGVLANLIMTVPAAMLLITGWLSVLTLLPGAAFLYRPLLLVAGYLARLLLWIAEWISEIPFSVLSATDLYLVIALIGGALLFAVGWYFLRRRGVRIAAILCAVVLLLGSMVYHFRMWDTVRFYAIPNQRDMAVCVFYRNRTVLVAAPTEANTLYAAREALRDCGVHTVDAVILCGNGDYDKSFAVQVLSGYLDAREIYESAPNEMTLWEDLTVRTAGDWVYMQSGTMRAAFDIGATTQPPSEKVNLIFCEGEPVDATGDSVIVIQDLQWNQPLPSQSLTDSLQAIPWLWVYGDGEVVVK